MNLPTMHRRAFLVRLGVGAVSLRHAAHVHAATPADLAHDIDILERAYTQLHPGLYRYATPTVVARRFDALKHAFAATTTLAERYRTLSLFLATVRCGHTYANFSNQSDAVAAALFTSANRLPCHFTFIDARMIVTLDQTGDGRLARGTEIVSIDGRTPREIVRALMPYMRADGSNDAKRLALLAVGGVDRYESFDVFYPLVFPVGDVFRLVVRAPGETRERRVEVAPIDLVARRAATHAALAGDADAPRWTVAMHDGVAVLTMPTWALYDSRWDWRGFLDALFADAAGLRGLVVDLRGNEGGLDCGHEIIAHLIDRDLPLDQYERRVRFRETPAELDPYLDTWDRSFRTLGRDAEAVDGGFYRLPRSSGVDRIAPKAPRLRAPVIVLVDAQNSSATLQFASLVRAQGLARLMGSPTGGNQRGINGGAFFFVRLPASGLEADLPLIGTFPATPKPDAGVAPDVSIESSVADIAAGRDRVLEGALATLRSGATAMAAIRSRARPAP